MRGHVYVPSALCSLSRYDKSESTTGQAALSPAVLDPVLRARASGASECPRRTGQGRADCLSRRASYDTVVDRIFLFVHLDNKDKELGLGR